MCKTSGFVDITAFVAISVFHIPFGFALLFLSQFQNFIAFKPCLSKPLRHIAYAVLGKLKYQGYQEYQGYHLSKAALEPARILEPLDTLDSLPSPKTIHYRA